MARNHLTLPVVGNSIPADDRGRKTTIGESLFPDVKNPTGHVLDLLKRQ